MYNSCCTVVTIKKILANIDLSVNCMVTEGALIALT